MDSSLDTAYVQEALEDINKSILLALGAALIVGKDVIAEPSLLAQSDESKEKYHILVNKQIIATFGYNHNNHDKPLFIEGIDSVTVCEFAMLMENIPQFINLCVAEAVTNYKQQQNS